MQYDGDSPGSTVQKAQGHPLTPQSLFQLTGAILFTLSGWLYAIEPFSARGLWEFAESLSDEGDYYRAITEYKRLIHFYPKDKLSVAARKRIADALERAERFEQALDYLSKLSEGESGNPLGKWAGFRYAQLLFKMERYASSLARYEYLKSLYPDRAGEAELGIGLCYLMLERYDDASEAFRSIPGSSAYYSPARELLKACEKGKKVRKKSPALAGLMAVVIPGSGHFYAGRYRDGVASFLLNAGFAAATSSAFNAGAKTAGVVIGLFGLNWYLGNIFGAVNFAHRFNKEQKEKFRKDVLRKWRVVVE